jgi:hypothetical protein
MNLKSVDASVTLFHLPLVIKMTISLVLDAGGRTIIPPERYWFSSGL